MKIYLGPWKNEERYFFYTSEKTTCYFRQVLTPKFIIIDNMKSFIGEPEIFFDSNEQKYCAMRYTDNVEHPEYGELLRLMDDMDETLHRYAYGLFGGNRSEVVLLTQDQFDKLSVLL